ncbi:meckelin isoform 3-T3 [Syngnathus typhle]
MLCKAQQQVDMELPLPHQEKHFATYIICAFVLKAMQFLHKLIMQLSVDVFFIDWEKPRTTATRTVTARGQQKQDLTPVSIWRTYFVANEWNKIQTIRRTRPTFQIMAVLFFIEVLGFSEYTFKEPQTLLKDSSQMDNKPSYSTILRYGLASTLWLCIGFLQVIFTVFYEICVTDKIRQFPDLCSISNISVLLLPQRCYGYYIHGRSVHGHADTNMEEMSQNLRREAESLCGQRGLLPNTDMQTFQVALSTRLRSQYDKIRESFARRYGPTRLMEAHSANQWEQNIRAYHTMNHFLGSIIDHAHPDMDYYVRDKLALERLMGMEFLEPIEKSIFYNDEAHSFSDVLFHGHESTLLLFDALFFCVADLACQNFVLAGLLTYIQQKIFRKIRIHFGKKNLAYKTQVDERFLIADKKVRLTSRRKVALVLQWPDASRKRKRHTMATGTLLFIMSSYKIIFTLFFVHLNPVLCQQYIIPFQSPSDCSVEEYFDISSLSCVSCGENQQRSATGLSCVCQNGFRTVTTDLTSIACEACPEEKPAVTQDGFECIRCPGSTTDEGRCQCPPRHILVERDVSGNLLDEATCEICNGNGSAFSVPNSNGDRCERCQASFIKSSCVCNPPSLLAGGLCIPPGSLSTNVNPSVNFAQLKFSMVSAWFLKNLYSSAAACLSFSNLTACQALGNMCVMNMHSFSGVSVDACGIFNTVFRSQAAFSSTQDISYWRHNLPWLYYGDEPGLASRVLQSDPVPVSFVFRGKDKNTDIKLLAAVYNVRGEFFRWETIGGANLQICPETPIKRTSAFSFGTAYQENCDLSIADLLRAHPEPLFYDVFLDLGGEESRELLPLPTLVLNQQYNGKFINQESMTNWYLSRRIFLVDALSGREKSAKDFPKVIRVANAVKIRFNLVPGTQQGQVFPPLMTVEYKDVLVADINTQTVSMSFSVEYEMDQNEARLKTDTALGVLAGLAVLLSVLKTVSWKRRIASPVVDLRTMLMFFLFYAGDLANVFLAVTVGTGLYWLILYKAQQNASVILPLSHQEEQFVTYICCAFALKAVQFLHKLIVQLSLDVFFIDWERPRIKTNRNVPANGQQKRDPSPVSIWRTYFVANEWNEIQTIRKIRPTFQIMAVLFFLEVLGFSSLALRDPWPTLQRPPQVYTPSCSLIMRYGLSATLWLCVGFLQVIFFTVFYEHFVEDKIRQFVDLCSISNISVLLLPQRCFGYYIHGRSVHGHADTNMEEMNNNLRREAESLCGQRGLLPNTDMQTFQVALSGRLRSHYDRIRDSFTRRHGPSRLMDPASFNQSDQNIRAYQTMNHFLGSVIDHAHPDMDYIVRDKLALERVMGMEFLEPNDKSIFYNDEGHSFADVLFYGNEGTLLIFDMLFFCVVDLASQNFVLAAVLTYLQQMIFERIRNSFGRRNLVNKTLVDDRFLI